MGMHKTQKIKGHNEYYVKNIRIENIISKTKYFVLTKLVSTNRSHQWYKNKSLQWGPFKDWDQAHTKGNPKSQEP